MKKASIVLLVIGVLLVFWGVNDFYNWATTGKELLEHYSGEQIIEELVNYTFSNGLIKVIAGALIAGISFILFRKKQ